MPSSLEYVTDTSRLPEHRGHRAGQPPSLTEVDVDVVGLRLGIAVSQRGGGEQRGLLHDLGGFAPAELARWQRAAPPLRLAGLVGRHATQHVAEHAVADRPFFERVDVDGHGVLDAVDVPRQREVERAEEPLDRVLEERDEIGEHDVVGRNRRQRAGR